MPAEDQAGEQAILQRRAALLARRAPAAAGSGTQALELGVAGQRCLLGLEWVREVRPLRALVAVPLAPAALSGLAHVRGRMLPVLDLAGLLGVAGKPSAPTRLVVLGESTPLFAVAADVHGIIDLVPGDAERRSRPLQGLAPDLVRGVTAEGQLLLDGERLLAVNPALPPDAVPTAVNPEES